MSGISFKEPQTILAIVVLIGMALGPWILHEKTLARVEFKLDSLDFKVSALEKQAAANEATLRERKKTFEDNMDDLKREIIKQKSYE